MEHLKEAAKSLITDLGRRGLLTKVDETLVKLDKIRYPVVWYRPGVVGVMFGGCFSLVMYLGHFKSQGFELEMSISPAEELPDSIEFITKAYDDLVQFMYDVCLEEYGIGAHDLLMSEVTRMELDKLAGVNLSTQEVLRLLEQHSSHSKSGSFACTILSKVLGVLHQEGINGDLAAYNSFRTMQSAILVSLDSRSGVCRYSKRRLGEGLIGNESVEVCLGGYSDLKAELHFYLVTKNDTSVLRTKCGSYLCSNDNYCDFALFEFKPAGDYKWLIKSGDYLLPEGERWFSESFLQVD